MSWLYPTVFALYLGAVIVILAADLASGRMRNLPSASLFVTVHIAIVVAYLAVAGLFLAPIPLIFGSAFIALVVAYLALGTAQATAIAAGLKQRGGGEVAGPARRPASGLPAGPWQRRCRVGCSGGMGLGNPKGCDPLFRTSRCHCGPAALWVTGP